MKDNAPTAAPRNPNNGDGSIDALDVQEAQNYSVGFSPKTPASGPTSAMRQLPDISSPTKLKDSIAAPRTLFIQNVSTQRGQDVDVNILVDAMGDEVGYTFSINYESAKLSNPRIASGGIMGETIVSNTTTPGQIGFSVRFGGVAIPAGNNQVLVKITFTVSNTATFGASPITFGSTPAPQRTSNAAAEPLDTTYNNGAVNILAPTAASVSVSGRINVGGRNLRGVSVALFDAASGETFYTMTDIGGVYRFNDVPVGADYIITPQRIGYTFNPGNKFLSLTEELTDVNFTAVKDKGTRR